MFDIGFSELMVIGLVALIVIGPERLPRVARTMGHLVGRLQRYVSDVKADINREVELEDLKKMRDSVQEAATSIETSVHAELNKAETELNSAAQAMTGDAAIAAAPPAGAATPAEAQAAPAEGAKPALAEPVKQS